jgi:photosystem II stability/assembly factor-like uncharacterized protein
MKKSNKVFAFVFIFFLILNCTLFSDNCKSQWIKTNGPNGGWCRSLCSHNGFLFAMANMQGIYRSSDNGDNWTQVYNYNVASYEADITSSGSFLFAAIGSGGVLRSSNNGNSWEFVNTGFPYSGYTISTIASVGQYIICAGYSKTFRSSNYGASWDSCTSGMSSPFFTYSLTTIGTNIYAGTGKGAFVSTNFGSSWNLINNGITTLTVDKIGTDGSSLYAVTSNGVYRSTNNGTQWFSINNGIPQKWYYDIIYDGSYIFVTSLDSLYRSSNSGSSWEVCNNGLVSCAVIKYCFFNGRLFSATCGGAGIQYTTNHGSLWVISNNGFHSFYSEYIAVSNNLLLTCGQMQGFAVSSNDGVTWQSVSNSLIDRYTNCVAANSTCIFLSTGYGGMLKSTNNGLNWNQCNNGLPSSSWTIFAYDDVILITSYDYSYRSTNNGLNWYSINPGFTVSNLARVGNVLVAGNPAMENGGLSRSTDIGATWTNLFSVMPSGLVAKDSIFYFRGSSGMYKSTNLGLNWVLFNTENIAVQNFMVVIENKLVALNYDYGIFTSSNNGVNWVSRNQGFYTNMKYYSIIQKGENVFIGTDRGVWKRTKLDLINIKKISSEIPKSFSLEQNYPNPFNPTTKIKFDIPKVNNAVQNIDVSLKVYDVTGREIMTLVNEKLQTGSYEYNFEANGLSSGAYFYKLTAGDFSSVKKLVLVR